MLAETTEKMIYITSNTFHKINSICQLTDENIIGNTELNKKFIASLKNEVESIENVKIKYYHKPKNKFAVPETNENNNSATYHIKSDCRVLHRDYKNFPFPEEIIESILAFCKVKKSTDEETKQFLQNEYSKYKQLANKHFPNFDNVDLDNVDFINEVDNIWNVKKKINFISFKNSGTIEIEDLNLNSLKTQIDNLLEIIKKNIDNKIEEISILIALYNIFVCNNSLKYKNNKQGIIQNEIQNILQKTERIDFETHKYIPIFFQIFLNKNLKFENNLSEQLNLTNCANNDCMSEILLEAFGIIS